MFHIFIEIHAASERRYTGSTLLFLAYATRHISYAVIGHIDIYIYVGITVYQYYTHYLCT